MTNGRVSWKALALLATGAAAVRLVYLLAFARDYTPRSDANHYQAIAKAVAQGDGIAGIFPFTFQHPTAFRPPLYPALLGAVYWVTGVHVGVGQLVNVALGVAVVVLAALLGAHIAGYRAGIAAGIVVGVYPPLLANDVVLLSEPLGLALLLTMILLLVRDRPAWAGAVCGLLVLTRPSAQLLVVVVAAWLVWRAGWRSAARFGAVTIVVVAPWVVRNWVLVGTPTVVTSNGFNLVSTYSSEAQASGGFADAVFDDRFTRINLANRSEVDLEDAYRDHAIDAVRDHHTIPLRVLGHNFTNYFEFRPDKNANAEEDDGRNLAFRYATLPLFYVVTGAGLVGLWRASPPAGRRAAARPGRILHRGVPGHHRRTAAARPVGPCRRDRRRRADRGVDGTAGSRARRRPRPGSDRARWSRRTRILVALAAVAGVVLAAGGVAFARDRVEDNARSQLERTIDRDGPAVQRLAALDADALVGGAPAPTSAEYREAEDVADRLWLLSPRLGGAARTQARDAARTLDEAVFELKVLDLVTSGNRNPGTVARRRDRRVAASRTKPKRVRATGGCPTGTRSAPTPRCDARRRTSTGSNGRP